jgi:hypothetical protein
MSVLSFLLRKIWIDIKYKIPFYTVCTDALTHLNKISPRRKEHLHK